MLIRHAQRSARSTLSLAFVSPQRRGLKIPSLAAVRRDSSPAEPPAPSPPKSEQPRWSVLVDELGSFEEDVRRSFGEPSDAAEKKRAVWADPHVRMLQGEPLHCGLTSHVLPPSHVLSFRVARHTPLPSSDLEPLPRERMVVVPTDLLHPDWVASPSEAEVLRSPMTLALDKDVVQGMLFPPKQSFSQSRRGRLHLFDFPNSTYPSLISSTDPGVVHLPRSASHSSTFLSPPLAHRSSSATAGAVSVPALILEMIQDQLEERLGQEAELLLERALAADGQGGQVLRVVGEQELSSIRSGRRPSSAAEEGEIIALLDVGERDPTSNDASAQRPSSPICTYLSTPSHPAIHLHPLARLVSPLRLGHLASRLASISSASSLPSDSPVFSLPATPARTFALLSAPSLLSSRGLDPFPLYKALWRLRIWTDEPGWALRTKAQSETGRQRKVSAKVELSKGLPSAGNQASGSLRREQGMR